MAVLRSDIGKVREINEDSAWMNPEAGIYCVADGMGGHLAGEVASRMAVEAVEALAQEQRPAGILKLDAMMEQANARILEHARTHPECSGMGTTLSVLWFRDGYGFIAHVGDSRIYRYRGGVLSQMTMDHSLVAEMVRCRILTPEQARNHPRRNIITRALGTAGDNEPELLIAQQQPGDVWLLCSDGLSGVLEDGEMTRCLKESASLEEAGDALIAAALEAGGPDNVTLILTDGKEKV